MDTKGVEVFRFSLPSRKYAAGRVVGENSFFDFCADFWGIGEFVAEAVRLLFLALAVWVSEFPRRFPGGG